LSNKTPIPNPISKTPENTISSLWWGRKSGIIGKYDSVKKKWKNPLAT
jgi:hypothetical protein